MQNNSEKTRERDAHTISRVKHTAQILGVSEKTVKRCLDPEGNASEQMREKVMAVYMSLYEGQNLLLQSVKQLIPLN